MTQRLIKTKQVCYWSIHALMYSQNWGSVKVQNFPHWCSHIAFQNGSTLRWKETLKGVLHPRGAAEMRPAPCTDVSVGSKTTLKLLFGEKDKIPSWESFLIFTLFYFIFLSKELYSRRPIHPFTHPFTHWWWIRSQTLASTFHQKQGGV